MSSRGAVRSCTVCTTLQEASHTPYFYECLFEMSQKPIPRENYEAWRMATDEAMRLGKELWDCGVPLGGETSPG
jgi:hypothetical protein